MWPSGNGTTDTSMQGGSFLATNDHAQAHRQVGSAVNGLVTAFGTTPGTNILLNIDAAGEFVPAVNSGGTLQDTLAGTFNNSTFGTPSLTGGTYNAGIFGTPTIGTITVPGTVNALSFSAAIAPGVGSVADSAGGTLVVNAQQGNIFYSVMGTSAGNRTVGTPQNISGYQLLTFAFQASGSANGTLVWSPLFHVSQDSGTPSLGTGTSWSYYSWRYNQISSRFEFQGNINNIT